MQDATSSGDELMIAPQDSQSLSKKGTPWSVEEHYAFLRGLEKLGRGNWRGISRFFVPTRTPTQVASHAQKHFLRLGGNTKRRSRFSAIEEELYGSSQAAAQSAGIVKPSYKAADSAARMPSYPQGPMPGYKAAVAAHVGAGYNQPMSRGPASSVSAPYTPPIAAAPIAGKPELAGPMVAPPGAWVMPHYMAGKSAGGAGPAMWMAWPPGMPQGMQFAMAPVVTLPGTATPHMQQQQSPQATSHCSEQQPSQQQESCSQQQQAMVEAWPQQHQQVTQQGNGMAGCMPVVVQGFPCMPHHTMLFQGYPPQAYFGMPPGAYLQTPGGFPAGPVVSYPSPPEEQQLQMSAPVSSCARSGASMQGTPAQPGVGQPACATAGAGAGSQPRMSPASSTSTSTHPTCPEASQQSHSKGHAAPGAGCSSAQEGHHLATFKNGSGACTSHTTTAAAPDSGNDEGQQQQARDATDVLLAAAAAVEAANAVACAPLPQGQQAAAAGAGNAASSRPTAPGAVVGLPAAPMTASMGMVSGGPVCVGAGGVEVASFRSDAVMGNWTPAAVDLLLSQVVPDSQAAIAQAQARLSPKQ